MTSSTTNALSRGASITYYTLFAIAPALLIIVAIAGLVFGHDAAQGAIVDELGGLMGRETAEATQAMVRSASDRMTGKLATLIALSPYWSRPPACSARSSRR
jgi:membrane protein